LTKEDEEMQESLMSKEEKKEADEKKKLWGKVEKHLGLMVGVGVKVVGGEEVVRIGQGDLRRLEERNEERRKRWAEKKRAVQGEAGGPNEGMIAFEVNVVGVRVVIEKGRVRHKSHDEFLIRTKRPGVADVFVSRRYGDFKRLADELRLAFPDYPLPPPPPKDKSIVQSPAAAAPSTGYSYYNPLRAIYGSGTSTPVTPPSSSPYQSNDPHLDSTTSLGSTSPLSR